MNGADDQDLEPLEWDLEERDVFMAEHEADEVEPPTEVVVEVDE